MSGQTWIGAHTGCVLQDNNTLEQSVADISLWKPPRSWGKHTDVWRCLSFASSVHLRNLSLCFGHKSRRRKKVHILRASESGGHHGKSNWTKRKRKRCSDPKTCFSEQITNLRQYLLFYLKTTYSVFLNSHAMTHLGETWARIPMNPCRL